ncbi:hypothetical protein F383_06376 [Gossypium arboreum]|uniref:Uncharacterized protein n=1 Tax=Gossypium arboreum TaxID=29729 RepID=A0A0B0PM31_GOSAR|nr:hypothetical protein F383_06376 [Gossypium arboreum]
MSSSKTNVIMYLYETNLMIEYM